MSVNKQLQLIKTGQYINQHPQFNTNSQSEYPESTNTWNMYHMIINAHKESSHGTHT